MPVRTAIEAFGVLMYLLAAVSGGLGGAGAAGILIHRQGQIRAMVAAAYLIHGAILGLLVLAFGEVVGVEPGTLGELIGYSIVAGLVGALALSGSNVSARMILRRLGFEVEINLRRREDGRGRDG